MMNKKMSRYPSSRSLIRLFDRLDCKMLLQSYTSALFLAHGIVAPSYKGNANSIENVLRSGREYSSNNRDDWSGE
jgi:hypothetical protein